MKPNIAIIACLASSTGFGIEAIGPKPIPPELIQPLSYKPIKRDDHIYLNTSHGLLETTIVPEVQDHLESYIAKRGKPISAAVVIEIKTGAIIAMVEGKPANLWSDSKHTALHTDFPSASLFKTVVAAAGIEIAGINPYKSNGLIGGCAHVASRGHWQQDPPKSSKFDMNLKRAYGHSCNGFFAKITINDIGLGPILEMVDRFHWNRPLPANFYVPISPINVPSTSRSSVQTVGKFAAGFGQVGSSVVHSAWRTAVIANDGVSIPLKLFQESPFKSEKKPERIVSSDSAKAIREIMDATVKGGTASSAFYGRRFRVIRQEVGGKTGTLTGSNPAGITTWFSGIYPLSHPEIVVSAVTIIDDYWIFKAPQLGAEAIAAWRYHLEIKKNKEVVSSRTQKNNKG